MNASPLIFLTKVGLLEVLHQQAVPVLVPASRIGLIKAVLPVVEDLEHAGMYMTARLKTQILDAAGE